MRNSLLFTFVWSVDRLDDERRPITFYSIWTLKTGLSKTLILDFLDFCKSLGFLSKHSYSNSIRYYKKVDWYLLREYAERKNGFKIREIKAITESRRLFYVKDGKKKDTKINGE